MALDMVDHVLLGMAQRQHERFLKQLRDGELRDLRERLATKTAANEGHAAIVKALVEAYQRGDHLAVDDILGNYERRDNIYQAAYLPVYRALKP
jgi:arginine deiminase